MVRLPRLAQPQMHRCGGVRVVGPAHNQRRRRRASRVTGVNGDLVMTGCSLGVKQLGGADCGHRPVRRSKGAGQQVRRRRRRRPHQRGVADPVAAAAEGLGEELPDMSTPRRVGEDGGNAVDQHHIHHLCLHIPPQVRHWITHWPRRRRRRRRRHAWNRWWSLGLDGRQCGR